MSIYVLGYYIPRCKKSVARRTDEFEGSNGSILELWDMQYPEWPPTENQPALSYSNIQVYERCRRKWFLQYLRNYIPKDIMFDIAIQRQLLPVTMLGGAIVDAVVKMAMRRYMRHREWRPDLQSDARKALDHFVEHSKLFTMAIDNRERWPVKKHTWIRPLDMIYYDGEMSTAQEASTMAVVDTCLTNFIDFMKSEDMHECDPEGWRIPESGDKPNPWFWSGEIPVYAGYDFAVVDGRSLRIIDWKAGKSERSEYSARDQLVWYATFAHHEWQFDFSEMILQAVWLQEDNKITRENATTDRSESMRQKWEVLYAEQAQAIAAVRSSPTNFEALFPMTEDVMACYSCPFKSCAGRVRLQNMYPEVKAAEKLPFGDDDIP